MTGVFKDTSKSALTLLSLLALASGASTALASSWDSWLKMPYTEEGNYAYGEADVQNYYQNNSYTYDILNRLNTVSPTTTFKINERSEFQAKNWSNYYESLIAHQHEWKIDISQFIQKEGATDFNGAKKVFFKNLTFNMNTLLHERPYHYMKEWGSLNHPPVTSDQLSSLIQFSKYHGPMKYDDWTLDSSSFFSEDFQKKIDAVSQSELTAGNTFELLADRESFDKKLQLINNAQNFIWVSSLVFVADTPTEQIAAALIQKHKTGLDIRVIDENSLRYIHPAIIKRFKQNGIKVVNADDFFKYNTYSIYHTKVMIIDGRQGILGGQNMIDADLNSNGTDFKNRDVDVLVSGPLVTDMMANFMEDWNHFIQKKELLGPNRSQSIFSQKDLDHVSQMKTQQRETGLRGQDNYSRWLRNAQTRMTGLGRYVAQKPFRTPSVITNAYLEYLKAVKTYLGITNPQDDDTGAKNPTIKKLLPLHGAYTNFDKLNDALQNIIKIHPEIHVDYLTSGVDFGVNEAVPMTMARIGNYLKKDDYLRANLNQLWVDKTNLYISAEPYKNLLRDYANHSNVDAWIYISFLHSKILYLDRIAASVGTFNIQHNATDQAFEATIIAQDSHLNQALDQTMVLDMANSVPFVFKNLEGKKLSH